MAIDIDSLMGNKTQQGSQNEENNQAEEQQAETVNDSSESGQEQQEEVVEQTNTSEESESSEQTGDESQQGETNDNKDFKSKIKRIEDSNDTTEASDDTVQKDQDDVKSLKEELDRYKQTVSEIESDEFLKRFIDYYKKTGDAKSFLQVNSVDWDSMSHVDVLRRKFDMENADLDKDSRDYLFQEELVNKYKIDPFSSQEDIDQSSPQFKIAQTLLKRDADKVRAAEKEKQLNFKVPEGRESANEGQNNFDPNEYKKQLLGQKEVASLLKNKSVVLELGEDGKFGFEVSDPEAIVDMMVDGRKFYSLFIDEKGNPDYAKQAKIIAYAADPTTYERSLIEYGKGLATEEIVKEKKNIDGRVNGSSKEAIEKNDFFGGFAKAARQQLSK